MSDLDEQINKNYVERLLELAVPNGECLDCHRKPTTGGYCKIPGNDWAHRFVCNTLKGPIPPGKIAMHTCDNRRCINPAHLVIGTYADNTQDMIQKGRMVVGLHSIEPNNALKVVTAAMLTKMRELEDKRFSQREIAAEFGVSQSVVWAYLRGHRVPI